MSLGIAYWVVMLVWFVFFIASHINPAPFGVYGITGHVVIIFLLLALSGWQIFGSALHK